MDETEDIGQCQSPEITNVSVSADITLVVGPTKRRIAIQSAILRETSEAFAAMLGANWKAPDVKTVDLPDDDPTAMVEICYALHHKYDKLMKPPSPSTLLEIAIIADKYFLFPALSCTVAQYWLIQQPYLHTLERQGCLGMMQLTTAAQMFGAAVAFRDFTRRLICDWSGSYLVSDKTHASMFIDEKLAVMLEAKRAMIKLEIAELLTDELHSGSCHATCSWQQKYSAEGLRMLRNSGIKLASSMTISAFFHKFCTIPDPVIDSSTSRPSSHSNSLFPAPSYRGEPIFPAPSGSCHGEHKNDKWRLNCIRRIAVLAEQDGLCLFCFNQGKWSTQECVSHIKHLFS